jgi:hypothetical protein
MKLTRIFYSPSEMRPKVSYFVGSSWVSPAPSIDVEETIQTVIVESF